MRPVTFSWLAVLLGVACAAIGWLGLAGWLAALVLAGCVAVHVAGNALGTRLRDATDLELARRARPWPEPPLPTPSPAHLQRRVSLGGVVPVSAAIGGVIGGGTGTAALVCLAGSSPAGAVLGGASSAVIGALAGFLAASFVEIVRTSLREAITAEARAVAETRG